MFEASRNLKQAVDNLIEAILEAGLGKILDSMVQIGLYLKMLTKEYRTLMKRQLCYRG